MTGARSLSASDGKALLDTLRAASVTGPAPAVSGAPVLSPEQKTVISAQLLHDGEAVANVARSWTLRGPLDPTAFETAFKALVTRHDALRFSVRKSGGALTPAFAPALDVALPCETFAGASPAERAATVDAIVAGESLAPLPLEAERMWRARLLRVDAETHVFAVVLHHAICDDWSWRILIHDLAALYRAALGGGTPDLPAPGSFASYLAARPMDPGAPLPSPPEIDWPMPKCDLPAGRGYSICTAEGRLDLAGFDALRAAARVHSCTQFTFFVAAYQLLLSAYCDQPGLSVSISAADRPAPADRQALGLFVREQEVSLEPFTHQRFDALLDAVDAAMRKARGNLASGSASRAGIVYYNAPDLPVDAGELVVEPRPEPPRVHALNLFLRLHRDTDGVVFSFHGQRQYFDPEILRALAACFRRILEQVIENPRIPLREIVLADAEQIRAAAARSVHTAPLASPLDISGRFAEVARSHPDATALETPDATWTYRDLDADTNRFAHWMLAQGLEAGNRLAVCMPRGTAVFRTWLAALKAGLTVVPVDSGLPAARVGYVLRESGSDALILPPDANCDVSGPPRVLTLPGRAELEGFEPTPPPRFAADPGSDAFLIFTSGTTGNPKSVPVSHVGIVRLVTGTWHAAIGRGDRMIQLASAGFDGSFVEVWGAWLCGAALVLCEKHLLAEGGLEAELRRLRPTAAFMTTSLFNTLVDADPGALAPLKYLSVGGEAASAAHCRRALAANPDLCLANVYGPTENGALTTSYRVPAEVTGNVPIGRPLPNNVAFVLSGALQPLPDEFAGELLVGGPGLSRGYENRPDLAAEKFIRLPAHALGIAGDGDVSLYRTGDRARWNRDGQIEFLGRRDTQFKFHGYRIEPSEIETALMEHPGIGRAAVVPEFRRGQTLVTGIVAYFEPVADPAPTQRDLRAFLSRLLPKPILPTRYVAVESIPLTPNGKADAGALRAAHATDEVDPVGVSTAPDLLTSIWCESLDRRQIPDDAEFFALGGTSLSLVRMVLEVERVFQTEIDFAAFWADPTLQRMRYMISNSPALVVGNLKHLRVLKQGDPSLSPIVLMPGHTGAGVWANDILPAMDSRNTVLALAFEMPGEVPPAPGRGAALIEAFLDDLEAWQAPAPLTLVGFSYGGPICGQLAIRAADRGLNVGRIIVIDGASPASGLGPTGKESGSPGEMLMHQFLMLPVGPITADCHLIRPLRKFPFAPRDLGLEWVHLAVGGVHEYEVDTFHSLMVMPPFAAGVARVFDAIMRDEAKPERTRGSRLDAAFLNDLNAIKTLAREARLAEAADALQRLISATAEPPDWAVVAAIRLYRAAGVRHRVAKLRNGPPLPGATAYVWQNLFIRGSRLAREMLERCYAASGAQMSGALLLLEERARQGDNAGAARILHSLAADPRFDVERGIAEGVLNTLAGDPAAGYKAMETVLVQDDAGPAHVSWCAVFFARAGLPSVALDVINLGRPRFRDAMEKTMILINAIARRQACSSET
ncbi:non-ribosomal peptide synthetase [Thetidibacter halocola]|uniref:Amino acid adenylation domain-containing protein n=1 Tax=Thetidibacter halocola TaxID=2827239 RepID=A0A8J7WAD8_9RHOB|nr:non-ribosomal peptide synthetase [Thetidibacter halocola]MBS0123890.1 amino acid adenylation domain-containing protein [Thetidibacter halocola]